MAATWRAPLRSCDVSPETQSVYWLRREIAVKHHIMIALGVLLLLVFSYRGALALLEPGIGGKEAYLAGGLILSGWLIIGGIAEWRHTNRNRD